LLKKDQKLKEAFEAAKKSDKLSEDGAQLDWVYRHSPYFEEKTFRQYPVYRVL
jgi:hypothetical protein